MTEETIQVQEVTPDVQATPEQLYLQELLNKFNQNPEDLSLSGPTRTLLKQVQSVTKELSEMFVKADELTGEVQERQNSLATLQQQVLLKRGQSQGLIDALLALREE